MKFIELIEKLGKECREREKNGSPIGFKNYEIDDILDLRYGIRYQKIGEIIIERKVKLHFDGSISLEYRNLSEYHPYYSVDINSTAMVRAYGKYGITEYTRGDLHIVYKGSDENELERIIKEKLGITPF